MEENRYKKCKECGEEKLITEFPVHCKKKNTYRAQCFICYRADRKKRHAENPLPRRAENKRSYLKHRERRMRGCVEYQKRNPEKVKIWVKKTNDKLKKDFDDFKSTCFCSECGENDPACLDFHHVDPSTKKYLITKIRKCRNLLREELKKCIVLCANCHRKHHNKEKEELCLKLKENQLL
jgi:hypothetical protein